MFIILILLVIFLLIYLFFDRKRYYDTNKKLDTVVEKIKYNIETNEYVEVKIDGYDVLGFITIEKLGLEYPIINYSDKYSLNTSIVKYSGPNINELGNIVLAGHRSRNGLFFAKINKLAKGDVIKLTDIYGNTINYIVDTHFVVKTNDTSVLLSTDRYELTLISCTLDLKDRYIIKAYKE